MAKKRKMDCASIESKEDCKHRKDCAWDKETDACREKSCQDYSKLECVFHKETCVLTKDGICNNLLK